MFSSLQKSSQDDDDDDNPFGPGHDDPFLILTGQRKKRRKPKKKSKRVVPFPRQAQHLLSRLPGELWTELFLFLPVVTICNLRCVSREFFEICSADSFWQRLCLRDCVGGLSSVSLREEFQAGLESLHRCFSDGADSSPEEEVSDKLGRILKEFAEGDLSKMIPESWNPWQKSYVVLILSVNRAEDDFMYKVVFLGASATGKTCIVKRGIRDEFDPHEESTIGAAFLSLTTRGLFGFGQVRLDVWDTAGQERYRSLAPMYYRGSHGVVVVSCVCCSESVEAAKVWIAQVRREGPRGVCVVVAVNKIDLLEANAAFEANRSQMKDFAVAENLPFAEVSSKTGEGIKELFELVVQGTLIQRIRTLLMDQS